MAGGQTLRPLLHPGGHGLAVRPCGGGDLRRHGRQAKPGLLRPVPGGKRGAHPPHPRPGHGAGRAGGRGADLRPAPDPGGGRGPSGPKGAGGAGPALRPHAPPPAVPDRLGGGPVRPAHGQRGTAGVRRRHGPQLPQIEPGRAGAAQRGEADSEVAWSGARPGTGRQSRPRPGRGEVKASERPGSVISKRTVAGAKKQKGKADHHGLPCLYSYDTAMPLELVPTRHPLSLRPGFPPGQTGAYRQFFHRGSKRIRRGFEARDPAG